MGVVFGNMFKLLFMKTEKISFHGMSCSHLLTYVYCLTLTAACGADPGDPGPPNLLFIFSDDQRFDALGIAGHPVLQTPELDALAREGVMFSQAYCQSPMCAPSRMTVLTGLTQRSHGGIRPFVIDEAMNSQSFPALLKASGYQTALIGKPHFQLSSQIRSKAFDVYIPVSRPYFKADSAGNVMHSEDIILHAALDYIDAQKKDQPFALSVWFNFPHAEDAVRNTAYGHYPWNSIVEDELYNDDPILPPRLGDPAIFEALPEFVRTGMNRERWYWRWDTPEKYTDFMKAYLRCITAVDRMTAEIRKKLTEMDLADNTVIIFTSDNGYFMGDRGLAGKWSHYNESVHVPMIIFDPRLPANRRGTVTDIPAMNVDIAPTMLDYAGVDIPATYQGISLRTAVENPKAAVYRDALYLENHLEIPTIPKWEGVRTKQYVYAHYYENDHEFLHDLDADPDQLLNFATHPDYEAILEQMRKRLHQFHQKYPEYHEN